jgi:phosphoribosyl 1,2-cyclic phosphate phosphodiesterase
MKSFNKNTLIALGTGTSTGIPMIGCHCKVCTSLDHRDQRLRSSIFIETRTGKKILVDTTPDLRTQLLTNKISSVDFVIITHDHADHLHGIDDLRPLTFGPPTKEIPLYCNLATKKSIEKRFHYIFKHHHARNPHIGGGIPRLNLNVVENEKRVMIQGEEFYFFNYPHGHGVTMGFYHAGFAYIVDCMEIPETLLKKLKKLSIHLLVIDCLKRGDHATHLTVDKTFEYIKQINPERAGLIHMGHDLSHQHLAKMAHDIFGERVFPLYDQMNLHF